MYTYIPGTTSYPWGLSFIQLLINGVFSYGPAVATALYIMPRISHAKTISSKKRTVIGAGYFIGLVLSVAIAMITSSQMLLMFMCGAVVVLTGELLLLVRSQAGILTSLIVTRDMKVIMVIWLQVVVVAIAYEIANFFFPFWVWLPNAEHSRLVVELVITFLGYVALFHPMIVMWQALDKKKK